MSKLKKPQRSLKAWAKQKWRTKSGKKSKDTGERYLPEQAIKNMTSKEYASTTAAKRKDKKKVQCKEMKQITKKKTKQCGVMTANKSGLCYYHD